MTSAKQTIGRILIANRGEIARRVIATCRALGIETVAVYADPDINAPHAREATCAVHLPGSAPVNTYLHGDLLVDAARKANADAVHPGYGFLSEDADFAEAVLAAGLIWIGPSPDAIRAMGSKIEAKRILAAAGVPVLAELDPGAVHDADLPVLVKASAGGGGRGMRVVTTAVSLADEIERARTEAARSFGDDTVFLERYLPHAHHVEVQVLADTHGTVWLLGERDCSVQRRHQKVIEETPSPLVERTPGLRDTLFTAAKAAVDAIGYVGAGTLEFLVTETGDIAFLEMNTRLQVEHTVTECSYGIDLVAEQIEIAQGSRLAAEPPTPRGHAIQARLYAEDPAAGFAPQAGQLHRFELPDADAQFRATPGAMTPYVRLDAAIDSAAEVTPHYDAMLAKAIVWAPERTSAIARLRRSLMGARIHGIGTNHDLLVRVLESAEFANGTATTQLLAGAQLDTFTRPLLNATGEVQAAACAAVADATAERKNATVLAGLPSGFRNLPTQAQERVYAGPCGTHEIHYRTTRGGFVVDDPAGMHVIDISPERVRFEDANGVVHTACVSRYDDLVCVDLPFGSVSLMPIERFPRRERTVAAGSLVAPTAGTVSQLSVDEGARVERGQTLLTIEAMKMLSEIAAPHAGTVERLPVAAGTHVRAGTVLAIIQSDEETDQ